MRALVRASLPLCRGVILDPFMGSGTTALAALELGQALVDLLLGVDLRIR
jgi:DNA modification methylase